LDKTKKIGDYYGRIFHQNSINEPREMSLVDLVFKTFSNWGKNEIPPSAAAANPIMVM
jgi:hypothetical protein